MIIFPQSLEIKWSSKNKKYYETKGYIYTRIRESFIVDINDLPKNSSLYIKCKCDYCNEIYNSRYSNAINSKRYACNKCKGKKLKDCFYDKYGVTSALQLTEFKEKVKQTNIKKYGVENVFQAEEIKDKIKQCNLDNYGVENCSQRKEIREKVEQTLINNYGVNNYSKTEEFKEKSKATFIKNYGVDNPMKHPDIKNKVYNTNLSRYGCKYVFQNREKYDKFKATMIKRYGVDNPTKNKEILNRAIKNTISSFYKNGTGPSSKQQRHICNLLNGKLNYPVDKCLLDIAFPDEMIYIEYDGGGHDLSVKFGNLTKEQFNAKEMKRQYYLSSLGWKLIRIKCNNDKLPSDDIIIKKINDAKTSLNNNPSSWYVIDFN